MNTQIAVESTATSSQEQVIRDVLEGRANVQINDATADFVSRSNDKSWRGWVVVLLVWAGVFAVVLFGLIVCTAAATGLLVRHIQL